MNYFVLYLVWSASLLITILHNTPLYGGETAGGGKRDVYDHMEINREQTMALQDKAFTAEGSNTGQYITITMTGDVMLGRGIDQILPHPSNPVLYESYVKDARRYLKLAEEIHGPIPYPVNCSYIWGDTLDILASIKPDLRLINLETSITASDDYWQGKGINYRMHPANGHCLQAAQIDHCSLANNHVLDWGYKGLEETLAVLRDLQIESSGAGRNAKDAADPSILEVPDKGRVLVFSYGHGSSGVMSTWAAGKKKPGVNRLKDFSTSELRSVKKEIAAVRQPGDIVVFSIHWGGNWGYAVPDEQALFAHKLIDEAKVDVVYGHSSHHVKGIEVYRNKLILYGCGDFLNDYEGISGYEGFRGDLALIYAATFDPRTGNLVRLQMAPTRTQFFKVNRASGVEAAWLGDVLNREGRKFGNRVEWDGSEVFTLSWE